ncbi:MAG: T9SS type A sorting domain-containing protein [Hyphomicrobiales bacterium]
MLKNRFFVPDYIYFYPFDKGHLLYGLQSGQLHYNIDTKEEATHNMNPADFATTNTLTAFADPSRKGRLYDYKANMMMGNKLNLSDDFGATSKLILNLSFDMLATLGFDPSNENVVYVAYQSNKLFKVDFSDMTKIDSKEIVLTGEGNVTMVYIDPKDANHMFVNRGNKLYSTKDAGENWSEAIDGFGENNGINIIVKDPNNDQKLIAGAMLGIYSSEDNGETWKKISDMKNANKISFSPTEEDVLVAVSYTNTMVNSSAEAAFSVDGGEEWFSVKGEVLDHIMSTSAALNFIDRSVDIYFSTIGLGVVKYSLSLIPESVNETQQNNFVVYPNPATDVVTFKSNNNTTVNKIEIFTTSGIKVKAIENSSSVSVKDLNTGIYLFKATDNNNQHYIQKMVVK